jgi:hypothetical protein
MDKRTPEKTLPEETPAASKAANAPRWSAASSLGHYESWFMRANAETGGDAFWIRYTIFSPKGNPAAAIAELWAIVFDSKGGRHAAAKTELPISKAEFGLPHDPSRLSVRIGDSTLQDGRLAGSAGTDGAKISWDLKFEGGGEPLIFLPPAFYDAPLPKAKSLVPHPSCRYSGRITLGDRVLEVADWIGSQNHNWGSKHTDSYAWGQVAGLDNEPKSFLEVATARIKIGPLWTPRMTPLVLRIGGEEYALNSLGQILRADARWELFWWAFKSQDARISVQGRIEAKPADFVGLRYYDPPGGTKHCLNSKIASCELKVTFHTGRQAGTTVTLVSRHRAAFEILTDRTDHGIELRA